MPRTATAVPEAAPSEDEAAYHYVIPGLHKAAGADVGQL